MAHFRVFGLLSITLCFVFCLCAHAIVNVNEATETVKSLQALTMGLLEKAQNKYKEAQTVKENVELHKAKAEKAVADAETAAKDNEEAKEVAERAKSALSEVMKMYADAKDKAEKAATPLEALLSKARALDQQAAIQILPDSGLSDDYSKVSENALTIKKEVEKLQSEVNGPTPLLTTAKDKLLELSGYAERAEVAKYQSHAMVAVAGIEEMIKEAEDDIKAADEKRKEVSGVVEEMYSLFKNTIKGIIQRITGFVNNAESELNTVSRKVNDMEEAKKAIVEMKKNADSVLLKVKKEVDEVKAREELQHVNFYAEKAAESLQKIHKALQSADANVANANFRKQDALNAILQNNGNPDQAVMDGTTHIADKWGLFTVYKNTYSAITASLSLLLAFTVCVNLPKRVLG